MTDSTSNRPAPEDRPSLADYQVAARGPAGLVCPDCGCRHFFVVYTRQKEGHIERRRECRHCGRRITTWEREIGT
jgi:hypothetical protein